MAPPAPTLEQFLSGLRAARQEGEVRPTARPNDVAKRGRRRPDPFATVTAQARELFERLQAERPGAYLGGQLRTLQRRLKARRRTAAGHRRRAGASLSAGSDPC